MGAQSARGGGARPSSIIPKIPCGVLTAPMRPGGCCAMAPAALSVCQPTPLTTLPPGRSPARSQASPLADAWACCRQDEPGGSTWASRPHIRAKQRAMPYAYIQVRTLPWSRCRSSYKVTSQQENGLWSAGKAGLAVQGSRTSRRVRPPSLGTCGARAPAWPFWTRSLMSWQSQTSAWRTRRSISASRTFAFSLRQMETY
mmetsp:Transcript_14108/g.26391  ORF Transcript_14108/g.26391 Transcript_14108/m.26391 type:complete len:200 (+) Transcript_14108:176-775(+)